MSLYNLMHGYNGTAVIALALINKKPDDFGRFRDAWINPGGEVVCIFTRCGGGNREGYQSVFDEMRKDKLYRSDYDDDFDCTYATIEFNVPKKYLDLTKAIAPKEKEKSLKEKTDEAIDVMGAALEKKEVKKDMAEQVLQAIKEALSVEKEEIKA